jgi:exonuclease SbcC
LIRAVKLENWQSWKEQTIEFNGGLNVLLGLSDSGKSAIIRAIEWVILNRRPGSANSFIREGAKECCVAVEFDDFIVFRSAGKENKYVLLDLLTTQEQEFKAFNQTIPEPIQERINMEDINFQSQHETAFLFSSTSGEVARTLNEIVDLDIIDKATYNINSRIKDNDKELEFVQRNIDSVEEEVSNLDDRIEVLEPYVKKMKGNRDDFGEAHTDFMNTEMQISEYKSLTKQISDLESEIEKDDKYQKVSEILEPLDELLQDKKEVERDLEAVDKTIYLHNSILNNIDIFEKSIESYDKEIKELQDAIEEMQEGTCPLCEQEWRTP